MTPEQAIALARARLRLQSAPQAEPQPEDDPSILENVGRAAAKGASSALGFPGEVALAVPKAGAFMAGDQDAMEFLRGVSPTDAFADIFGALGVSTEPKPEGFRERMLTNTAEAVTGGAVGVGAGGMARGVIKKASQRLLEGRLGRFAAEDALAATAGAGTRTIAQEAGLDDGAASVTEFGASFLTGGILDKMRLASQAAGAIQSAGAGFRRGERERAAEFVQAPVKMAGEDPTEVAKGIRASGELRGSDLLTSGARSNSVALRSMENALIKSNPELQAKFIESKLSLDDFIRTEMKSVLGDGVSQDFIDHYRQSADWALHVTEKNRQTAIEQAAREIAELPPAPGMDFSTPIKRRLEEMKRIDRDIERDLWSQTGTEDVVVESLDPSRPFLKEAYQDLIEEQSKAGRASATLMMPDRTILGAVKEITEGGTATIDELVALRSSLLDAAAEASANQNENLARRLNKLAEGALNSMDGASGENAAALKQARQFSRDLNDRYSRDVISPLLSRSASRGEMVPANETMERLFVSGEKGRTNLRALRLASGEIPQDAKSYMLQRFYRQVISEEGINVKQAENFIKTHQPALEEAGLMDTVSSYVLTGKTVNRAEQDLADLVSSQSSDVAAQVLKNYGATGDDLVNFLGSTLKSEAKGSQRVLTEMFQNSLSDLSGNALKGLQAATAEGAIKAMYTAGGDASVKLPEIMTRVTNALRATGQFSDDQIDRVQKLGEILYRQSSSEKLRAFKGQSNTPQDLASASFIGTLARLAGLRAAGAINPKGPGSLATAGIIGRTFQKTVESMTKDDAISLIKGAVFDPEIMAALLEAPTDISGKSAGIIKRFLKATAKTAMRIPAGGLTPSQTTIVNEPEQNNGR